MPSYIAVVKDNYLAESAISQTPSVKLVLETTDALAPGGIKTFYADLWLTEKAIKRTIQTLSETFDFSGHLVDLEAPILAGKKCRIETNFEIYDGKTTEKVSFVNPENKDSKKRIAGKSIIANLSAKFDAEMKNVEASKPEDELPF